MAKKYFWLKLKDDFFQDKRIKKLRKIAGGDTYTVIYLKMQLLSLKNEGILFYEGVEDSFYEEIALEIDEDTDNVKFTIMFLQSNGLLEEVDGNSFALIETMNNIGSETQGAERVRRFRDKQKALHCNAPVTNGNTEIEKEKEKELDKDIDKEKEQQKENTAPPLIVVVDNAQSKINPFTFYQENGFGLTMNAIIIQKINEWCNDLSDELVVLAMQKAIESNRISWSYAEGILKKWAAKKVKSVQDVENLQAQFEAQQNNRQPYYKPKNKVEHVPEWFANREKAGTSEDVTSPTNTDFEAERQAMLAKIRG